MQCSFKAHPIELFIVAQVPAESRIVLVLGISQSDPPLITRGIDAFSTFGLEQLAYGLRRIFVVGQSDHHAAAFAQSVFVHEQLVFWQSLGHGIFKFSSGNCTNAGARRSQQRSPEQTDGRNRSNSGDECSNNQRTSGHTCGGSEYGSNCFSHSWLLAAYDGRGLLLILATGSQQC